MTIGMETGTDTESVRRIVAQGSMMIPSAPSGPPTFLWRPVPFFDPGTGASYCAPRARAAL